jgi:VWFA-related protein
MVSWLTMRRLAALLALFAAFPLLAQYGETVTVERILLDVRVTNVDFEPVTDLTAADFTVTIGGKKAEVLSAEWIEDAVTFDPFAEEQPADTATTGQPDHPGRLIVVFIQTDFARDSARLRGQMHFMQYAEDMLAALTPEDRVAVLSFDSHLKFRLDFTNDHQAILAAMNESLLLNDPPPPRLVHNPALGSRLDRDEMRRAGDSEAALLILGNALRNIPGPKTMLLLGWGLGQRTAGGVRRKPRYKCARAALEAARVTVFALDTTYADYHDLQFGLSKAAADTGGFYAKTHEFPQIAIDRLHRTLAGHYELELRRPANLRPGTHEVMVNVKRRGLTVLAPGTWMDR